MNTFISTDKSIIDRPWVCKTLRAEHWGWCLTDEKIGAIIERQLCFGLYECPNEDDMGDQAKQIGFACVLTDAVSVSLLSNVVIDKHYRRQGLGTKLLEAIIRHPEVKKTICLLGTRDAVAFYEKFGFGPTPYMTMQKDPL